MKTQIKETKQIKNIYEKINFIKYTISNSDIKKSGYNAFAKWSYMELSDFLPLIIKLMEENKLFSKIDYMSDKAILTIIDTETKEQITYESPMSSAELKGVHAIQNLGAVQTYLRRYLYVSAFDIVENDILDKTVDTKSTPKPAKEITENYNDLLKKLAEKTGKEVEELNTYFYENFDLDNPADLNKAKLQIIQRLQK
ncbi:hypothetical protein EOM09_05070 [bacterium]|nr:hypothetical protein [bacterium]